MIPRGAGIILSRCLPTLQRLCWRGRPIILGYFSADNIPSGYGIFLGARREIWTLSKMTVQRSYDPSARSPCGFICTLIAMRMVQ